MTQPRRRIPARAVRWHRPKSRLGQWEIEIHILGVTTRCGGMSAFSSQRGFRPPQSQR